MIHQRVWDPAKIDGWSNKGGAGSFVPSGRRDRRPDPARRLLRLQLEQFYGFRHIVGANWHAWSDRYIPGDGSLQINLGLVQCTDARRAMRAGRRWAPLDTLVAETNQSVLERIAARTGY